jgi:hypothetical protein
LRIGLEKSKLYAGLFSRLKISFDAGSKTIIEAIDDPELFAPLFRDLQTWAAWRVFLKALFALPMAPDELEIFRECTGRETAPTTPASEVWNIAGRRSGKSFIAALIAVFLAAFVDYQPYLSPGERAHIICLAADRKQAQVVFRYVKGFLKNTKLSSLVETEKAEVVELTNAVNIAVMTSSYRAIRGFTVAAVICDEISFWPQDESVNPAEETIRALRPSMASIPNSLLMALSSPYARVGPLYAAYREHWGKDSEILIWKAPTLTMNPTISQKLIDRDMKKDPEAARSEWGAEFRSDLETFLTPEALEAVTVAGRGELPTSHSGNYMAFVDPSGGRGDAAALAIAHRDGERVILDLARRWPAPHNPQEVVRRMAEILKAYRVNRVRGDRYAGEWPRQEFAEYSIVYEPSNFDKSQIYLEFLPLVLSGRIELLDIPHLAAELKALERRTRSLGRDRVDHPPGGHDDLANAAAGASTMCYATGGGLFAGCDLS